MLEEPPIPGQQMVLLAWQQQLALGRMSRVARVHCMDRWPAALLVGLLCGCSAEPQPPEAAKPPETSAERILLHARIEYESTWRTRGIGTRHFAMSLLLEQPAFRDGQGATARYSIDPERRERLQGIVEGAGAARVVSDDTVLDERYEKSASWPELQVPSVGLFSLLDPEPSSIGDGLQVQLKLHAAVVGTASAHVSSPDGSTDMEPQFAVPVECKSRNENIEGNPPGCGFDLDIDAVPTRARDAEGQIMLPKVRDALAQPNGEWVMALLGNHFGATTQYRERGHFVQRLSRTYRLAKDETESQIVITLFVWSTGSNEDWVPRDVPPVRTR
jgi:hypothetical protein